MAFDRIWRGSLALSALLHAAAVTATALLTVGGAEAGPVAVAPSPPQPAGLRGDTFEVEGLVRDAVPTERSAATGWALDQVGQLPRWLAAVRSRRADSTRSPAAGRPSRAEPGSVARRPVRPARPSDTARSRRQGRATAKPEPAATEQRHAREGELDGATARAAQAAASGAPRRASGRFGAVTDRDGVLLLAPAFTRAVPAAVSADPVWSELPAGSAGSIEITLAVDERGSVRELRLPDGGRESLRRLVKRTMAMLSSGRFALGEAVGAGSLSLRIEVYLSDEPPSAGVAGAGERPELQLGYEPPRAAAPGRAWFTTAAGRHFEARIVVLRSAGGPERSAPTKPVATEAGAASEPPPAGAGRHGPPPAAAGPRSSAAGERPAQVHALPSAPETG